MTIILESLNTLKVKVGIKTYKKRERYTCWQQTPIVYRYTDSNAVRNGCI